MFTNTQRRFGFIVLSLTMAISSSCQTKKQPEETENTAAVKEEGKPVIKADQPEFDFGKVKQGEQVSHVYKIKNVGNKELVIEKTHGS